jgi:hypothetical protein
MNPLSPEELEALAALLKGGGLSRRKSAAVRSAIDGWPHDPQVMRALLAPSPVVPKGNVTIDTTLRLALTSREADALEALAVARGISPESYVHDLLVRKTT